MAVGLPAVLVAVLLAACGAAPTPSPTAAAPAPDSPAARAAYQAAMCPLLVAIANTDEPLAALRAAGDAGGDMTANRGAMNGMADELNGVLASLDAVPAWTHGQQLRFELITALHAIRSQIVFAADHLEDAAAAGELAAIPYVAGLNMDRAMAAALEGGLVCAEEG